MFLESCWKQESLLCTAVGLMIANDTSVIGPGWSASPNLTPQPNLSLKVLMSEVSCDEVSTKQMYQESWSK